MASPSEFLTFYRRAASHPALRQTRFSSATTSRTFVSSIPRSVKTDQYPDSEHATNKKDKLDVQSNNANAGQKAKASDDGGSATQEKDNMNSTAKAKKEHPEAPDVVIGMQDERGGKGA